MTASEQHVFIRFMKKHKAWNKFKKQLDVGTSLSSYLNRVDPLQALTNAFPWNRTPQEWHYWYNLDCKLQKVAKNG